MSGAPRVCMRGTIPSTLFNGETERVDGKDKVITIQIQMPSTGTISAAA